MDDESVLKIVYDNQTLIKMCNNCFLTEVRSFTDKQAWASFDLELTQKITLGSMKHIMFNPDMQRDKDDGEDIYQCIACGQSWKLRNHYDNGDGYFLKLSSLEKVMALRTQKQKAI